MATKKKAKAKKAPSAKQKANWARFAEMARARAKEAKGASSRAHEDFAQEARETRRARRGGGKKTARRISGEVPVLIERTVSRKDKEGKSHKVRRTTVLRGQIATGARRTRAVKRLERVAHPAKGRSAKIAQRALARKGNAPILVLPGYMRRKRKAAKG